MLGSVSGPSNFLKPCALKQISIMLLVSDLERHMGEA